MWRVQLVRVGALGAALLPSSETLVRANHHCSLVPSTLQEFSRSLKESASRGYSLAAGKELMVDSMLRYVRRDCEVTPVTLPTEGLSRSTIKSPVAKPLSSALPCQDFSPLFVRASTTRQWISSPQASTPPQAEARAGIFRSTDGALFPNQSNPVR